MWRVALFVMIACACMPAASVPTAAPTSTTTPPPTERIVLASPTVAPTPLPTPFVEVDPGQRGWSCVADDPRIGEASLCSRFIRADLDGDGADDEIAFWLPGHETHRAYPVMWSIRLRTRTATATTQTQYPVDGGLIGTADVKGDGRPIALINVGHGASTIWVGVLAFDGTHLRMNTEPLLLFSGSVRHGDAIECRHENGRDELVGRQVSDYTAEDQWDLVERVFDWRGADLHLVSITKSTLDYRGRQPTPVGRYWGLNCGTIRSEAWAWN